MIIFKYGETKLDSGYYVLEINNERIIAEYYSDLDTWNQIGIDYDNWQYDPERPELKVIAQINLSDLDIKEIK